MELKWLSDLVKDLGFPGAMAVVLLYLQVKTLQKMTILLALILAKLNLKDPEDKP